MRCVVLSVLCALVPTLLCAQAPPPSAGHELVYHDSLGMVVLVGSGLGAGVVVFGGYQPDVAPRTMIWVRDSTWRAGAQHGPRTHMRTAFDERANQLYVFGGMDAASAFMALKEGAWRRIDAPGPSPRYLPGLAYDRRRGVLVLFGGGDETGLLSDTWEFDGNSWRHRL